MRRLALVLLVGLLGAGCGASGAVHGGHGVVSPVGEVGPLTLGISTAAAVQRFAGRPDFSGNGTFEAPGMPGYTALAYDCSARRGGRQDPERMDPTAYRPSHTYCRTVYFVSDKTRRLGAFWTSSPHFQTRFGTHPGSSQSYANAHEDALPEAGCLGLSLSRDTGAATLFMANRGGTPHMRTIRGVGFATITGGVVADLRLEQAWYTGSKAAHVPGSSAVGLLFC